jgi:hypothetical protein
MAPSPDRKILDYAAPEPGRTIRLWLLIPYLSLVIVGLVLAYRGTLPRGQYDWHAVVGAACVVGGTVLYLIGHWWFGWRSRGSER